MLGAPPPFPAPRAWTGTLQYLGSQYGGSELRICLGCELKVTGSIDHPK